MHNLDQFMSRTYYNEYMQNYRFTYFVQGFLESRKGAILKSLVICVAYTVAESDIHL